jgi:hypothetical protein
VKLRLDLICSGGAGRCYNRAMVWPEYIHHVTLHFPIVGTLFLAAVGVWWVRTDDARLGQLLRFAGWFVFAATSAAAVSGMIAAPGLLGGDGPQTLSDHRNMGVTVWCTVAIAAIAFELGLRKQIAYVQRFAALCWCAAAFGVIGAGHWGGSALHSDKIPWQGTPPVIDGDFDGREHEP